MAQSSIPKLKVGIKSHPHSKLDLSFDSNTTSSVGFVQPIGCVNLVPDSRIDCKLHKAVRLAPVAAPTFGRFMYKTYGYYVPMRDLFMPYDNLVSGTPYNGSSIYVPSSLPEISIDQLTLSLLMYPEFSAMSIYVYDDIRSVDSSKKVYSNVHQPSRTESRILYVDILNHLRSIMPDGTYVPSHYDEPAGVNGSLSSTPEDCDFVIDLGTLPEVGGTPKVVVCWRLTRLGKNLRQIFLGLGYQTNLPSLHKANPKTFVNFLPLLAYYKAWFELFAVKRRTNWQSTSAAWLIQNISQSGVINIDNKFRNDDTWKSYIKEFIFDLSECYYTADPDFFTSHLDQPAASLSGVNVNINETAFLGEYSLNTPVDEQPRAQTQYANPLLNRVLERVLRMVNVNSALGARVSAYMKAHGLGAPDDNKESNYIGSGVLNVDVDPVMSMANTASDVGGDNLGDYAGQGYAQTGNGAAPDHFKFSNKEAGYFILLGTIVPRAGYCQGLDPLLMNTKRFDQYHPELDAMTFEVTDGQMFIGSGDTFLSGSVRAKSYSFGFTSLYAPYKVHNNIANGDLTLRSTRASMLPYFLDRYFTPADCTYDPENKSITTIPGTIPTIVNDELRTLGKVEGFGNFDRIFNITQSPSKRASTYLVPLEDNFIINNLVDLAVFAPVIPLSESFDTDYSSNEMSVEKA